MEPQYKMSLDEYPTDQYPDAIETVNASSVGIFAIISLGITITHCVKVYQDLFTPERKSLDHRRAKTVIDAVYKKATYLTLATAILYTILLLCNAIQYNLSKDCMLALIFIGWIAYFYSKAGLYLLYIMRLHQVYGLSKPTTLASIAGFIIVFCTAMYIYAQVLMVTELYNTIYDDTDNRKSYRSHARDKEEIEKRRSSDTSQEIGGVRPNNESSKEEDTVSP
eukprot:197964_1